MVFENAKTWFTWFFRKMRNDPLDFLPPLLLIFAVGLVVWLMAMVAYDSLHSQKAVCTKFGIEVYVDPKTGEERPNSEERCIEWISPVTGKPTTRKE